MTEQEQLSLDYFYETDLDRNRREHVYFEIGLKDGPLHTVSMPRGSVEAVVQKEIQQYREIVDRMMHDDEFADHREMCKAKDPEAEQRVAKYDAAQKEFLNCKLEDIMFVFIEDCTIIDPPILDQWGQKWDTEWNLWVNWGRGTDEWVARWRGRMVPYPEAVKRIAAMVVPPPKRIQPYKVSSKYKKRIDELLSQVVDVPDRDNAPHKLVIEQDDIQIKLETEYELLAAAKFRGFISTYKPPYFGSGTYGNDHYMNRELTQYDDWRGWYDLLKTHCQIEEWNGEYSKFPVAYWDVSADPDFAHSKRKIFHIRTSYYNAHYGGF